MNSIEMIIYDLSIIGLTLLVISFLLFILNSIDNKDKQSALGSGIFVFTWVLILVGDVMNPPDFLDRNISIVFFIAGIVMTILALFTTKKRFSSK